MNSFKVHLIVHSRETIKQDIADQVLPLIREFLGDISNSSRPIVDLASSERHMGPETHFRKKYWDKTSKLDTTTHNQIVTRSRTNLRLIVPKKITTVGNRGQIVERGVGHLTCF